MSSAELSTREVQLRCLSVLKAFDAVCRENHLNYYLSGGTLLGAIRHRGFIPWDDDVDVMMPRADYMKLLDVPMSDPRYAMFSAEKCADYCRAWARMTDTRTRTQQVGLFDGDTDGIYIDIFPIDGMPAGKLASRLFFARLRLLDVLCKFPRRKRISSVERWRTAKIMLRALLGWLPLDTHALALRMNRVAQKQPYETRDFRGVSMTTHYGARERMPAEVFDHAVDVEFEGLKLPAPCGWDFYLTRLYSDYMQLPPEHARASEHSASYAKTAEE